MATTTHHIYCNLHGNGVANSGSYPIINANFDIEFTREAGSSTVSWRTYNNTWSGTSSGNGHFAFQFYAYISINDSTPTWDDLKYLIYKDTTSWTTSWWNQVQLPTRNGTFTSTSSTMTLYIWVQSGLCTNGDAGGSNCYYNEYTASDRHFDLVKTFTLDIPEYEVNYTVSYDANGGVGAPPAQTKSSLYDLQLSTDIPTYLVNITHHNNPNNVLSVNRPFLKWTTNRDGTGASFSPGQAYRINADATLYAQWGNASFSPVAVPTKNVIVTYNANGGVGIPASVALERIKIGYNTDSTASTATYIPGTTYTTTTSLDLYPIYGTATLLYTDLPVPTRSGYAFKGWFTDSGCTAQVTADLTLTDDITLYAKWELRPIHQLSDGEWSDTGPYVWKFVDGAWWKVAHPYKCVEINGEKKWVDLVEAPQPADVFNHGSITGLNPYYADYNEKHTGDWTAVWHVYSNKICKDYSGISPWGGHGILTLGGVCDRGDFTHLNFLCEIPSGHGCPGKYNISRFGIRYARKGVASWADASQIDYGVAVTDYRTTPPYNYAGQTPWYELTSTLVQFDLTQMPAEPFYICVYACDCQPQIYSIWFE